MSTNADAWTPIAPSPATERTFNPIRGWVQRASAVVRPADKPHVTLGIGDPCVFPNLPPPEHLIEQLRTNAASLTFNGYADADGAPAVRAAIAAAYTSAESPLTQDDVMVTSGCSSALDIAITALAAPGSNLLVPIPGFSLYEVLCQHHGVEARHYVLDSKRGWEIDVDSVRALCDERTAAILINNPSNPCGSSMSRASLLALLALAQEKRIPVISDEIYADMVFEGETFHPLGRLSEHVPVLTVGGLAKRYMVPGWRVGWVMVHDRHGAFTQIRAGLKRLCTLILGANTLAQSIVPAALTQTPAEYHQRNLATLQAHAKLLCDALESVPGLTVIRPQGAMYMMVGIQADRFDATISNDVDFALGLLGEENVTVLPGSIFHAPNFVRLVVCPPPDVLEQAVTRIRAYCARHAAPQQ